jgi:hypothetical protein
MTRLDDKRLGIARRVHQELGSENELTASQARLFVRCLQSAWRVPSIQWSAAESAQQLSDARRLSHVAEILRSIEGLESVAALDCYRRSGEILEWLSRSADDTNTLAPIELLAAGAYQLGGLPAMATSLLKQTQLHDPGSRLLGAFLGGNFDEVIAQASAFWAEHRSLTGRAASAEVLSEASEDRVDWYVVVELVRALGLFSDALRRGNEPRLTLAQKKLRGLERLIDRACSAEMSVLVHLISASAASYAASSVYRFAKALAGPNNALGVRLHAFSREQFSRKRGLLWPSQQRGLARLLDDSSFALCTPTGSGKTLVANFALIKELLRPVPGGLAPLGLYLVPSRALAGEVEGKLTSELGSDMTITGLYGGSDWGITDYWLNSDKPCVLVATVEKADALMRYAGPILMARLRLMIIDEAHQVVGEEGQRGVDAFADHSSRSVRLEGFVSRVLSLRPDVSRIALTAVAGGAAHPVARWMEGTSDAVPVGFRYRSTRQLVGALEVVPEKGGQIVIDHLNGQPLFVRGRQDPIYIGLKVAPMPTPVAAVRNSINHFNQLNVFWTSLHLVGGSRRILISVAQKPEQTMRWFAEALALPQWVGLGSPQVSHDPQRLQLLSEARATCIDYCGPESHEVTLLDRGVATSHGQMPQRVRRLMNKLIDQRICPITVATATLTEGVNLPFDIIFVASLQRTSFDASLKRQVVSEFPTSEFRNLAGRAGRPGSAEGMEGMILVSLPQQPSATAAVTISTQRRQIGQMQRNYIALLDRLLAEERVADDVPSPLGLLLKSLRATASQVLGISDDKDFLTWLENVSPVDISARTGQSDNSPEARLADTVDELDSLLLIAAEEMRGIDSESLTGSQVEQGLSRLWSKTFTAAAAVSEAWLEKAFVRRGVSVVDQMYPDPNERRRLYQYGFTPVVGRRFEAVAPAIHAEIESADGYGNSTAADRLKHFDRLGSLIASDRGFGFRVRSSAQDQALLAGWRDVLAWWMNIEFVVSPDANELRAWQRFVADNLEFRLGVAVGAVSAQAWSQGAQSPLVVPSLASWKTMTGLPWFGFWAKELLRWGTLEPFVAFAMARGLAGTRELAMRMKDEFLAWLLKEVAHPDSEDYIDPQRYLSWQQTLSSSKVSARRRSALSVDLSGTDGRGGRYDVVPLVDLDGETVWIDASGFRLASSRSMLRQPVRLHRSDFVLTVDSDGAQVVTTFEAT